MQVPLWCHVGQDSVASVLRKRGGHRCADVATLDQFPTKNPFLSFAVATNRPDCPNLVVCRTLPVRPSLLCWKSCLTFSTSISFDTDVDPSNHSFYLFIFFVYLNEMAAHLHQRRLDVPHCSYVWLHISSTNSRLNTWRMAGLVIQYNCQGQFFYENTLIVILFYLCPLSQLFIAWVKRLKNPHSLGRASRLGKGVSAFSCVLLPHLYV